MRIDPPWSPPIAMSASPAATTTRAAGRRAAGRIAHLARIVDRAGRIGMAAAGKAEILAMRLADDGAAGVENARDDGGVNIGRVALERRGAVHHGHAGEADIVLQRDRLAGELAARRALDRRLDVPGVVLVLVAFGTVAGRSRIGHRRDVIRHGIDDVVGGVISLHQGIVGFEFLVTHMHAEILGYAAQLIESGSSDCHGLSPCGHCSLNRA